MTDKKIQLSDEEIERLLSKGTGIVLSGALKEYLKEKEMFTDLGDAPRGKSFMPAHEEIIKAYEDLMANKTHKWCYCPACLFSFYKQTNKQSQIREESFFYGWLLFIILYWTYQKKSDEEILDGEWLLFLYKELSKSKRSKLVKYDWKDANYLMYQITSDPEYFDDPTASRKRNKKYKFGTRNFKYVVYAYRGKLALDNYLLQPETRENIISDAIEKIHNHFTFLDEKFEISLLDFIKDKKIVTSHQILRRFSKKKLKDIYPFLLSLKKEEKILWLEKDNKIYYVSNEEGVRKTIKEFFHLK
ncbi:MAG: hypothetical protein MUP98_09550 [Candidatus Aminicenantes bacterium]|nr:hypothetical protein [Candidatus Aminicenantes bacterium]